MMRPIAIMVTAIFLFSCTNDNTFTPSGMSEAYVPIYISTANINQISVGQPKPIQQAGKIYAYGNYIFQNDVNTGIHIIDNNDKGNPKKIAFINLPLSTDLAVKGHYLYANNYTDMVVFDITNPASPQMVKRISDVFPPANQQYPPYNNVSFECPDASKGAVVGWELQTIKTPNCRR